MLYRSNNNLVPRASLFSFLFLRKGRRETYGTKLRQHRTFNHKILRLNGYLEIL